MAIGAGVGALGGWGFSAAAPALANTAFFSHFGMSGTIAAYSLTGTIAGGAIGYGAGLGSALYSSGGDWSYAHKMGTLMSGVGSQIGSIAGTIAGNWKVQQEQLQNLKLLETKVDKAISQAREAYVDDTWTALNHYLHGDGSPAYIGDNTLNALINSSEFQRIHQNFITGRNEGNYEGTFSVDMTRKVFHIGRTNVNYKLDLINGQSRLTYDVFINDGFWDPDFIDEKYGKYYGYPSGFNPDGMGPNLERFGGRPYHYIPRRLIYYFP